MRVGEKNAAELLQMMWIWFVCLFCIALQNISLCICGGFCIQLKRTHFIYKRKAISSMWSETFGFINRMQDFHISIFFFSRVFCCCSCSCCSSNCCFCFVCSYFYISTYMKIFEMLACDNGLCE